MICMRCGRVCGRADTGMKVHTILGPAGAELGTLCEECYPTTQLPPGCFSATELLSRLVKEHPELAPETTMGTPVWQSAKEQK